jgi:hypothetical protein
VERRGAEVRALCSADGREGFGAGNAVFAAGEPLFVGLHVLSKIDRMMWPGAYPEGTAIRFSK